MNCMEPLEVSQYDGMKRVRRWPCPMCGGRIRTRRGVYRIRIGTTYAVLYDVVYDRCVICHETIPDMDLTRALWDALSAGNH